MNSPARKRKRITVKLANPNPLFVEWLTEFKTEAEGRNSNLKFTFGKALASLKKYPLPLETGRDCKILDGFGDKLCQMLDDKLSKHRRENSDLENKQPPTSAIQEKKTPEIKPKTPNKEYIPQLKSGPYAILVALFEKSQEAEYPGYLGKDEVISKAQPYCSTSFKKPQPGTFYTAWSSMKTLLEKGLVTKKSHPPKFSLTEEGKVLADKLYVQHLVEWAKEETNEEPSITLAKPQSTKLDRHISTSSVSSSQGSSLSCYEDVMFAPNTFEILLLIDNQELNAGKRDPSNDLITKELQKLNVSCEVRSLKVGDYTWICRNSGNELVLPYIIERKRMDDFGSSIKNKRFHEQKFRLKQCGLKNVIYLVESYGRNENVGLPLASLYQAASNTLIHDEFTVKFTDDLKGTVEYLACLTNLITKIYASKTIVSCLKENIGEALSDDDLACLMHFKEFNKSSVKNKQFKVWEMFVKQLLQIKGMSVEKAMAVVERYKTPQELKMVFDGESPANGEKLLATLQCGPLKKNLGVVLSKTIYQLFNKVDYLPP